MKIFKTFFSLFLFLLFTSNAFCIASPAPLPTSVPKKQSCGKINVNTIASAVSKQFMNGFNKGLRKITNAVKNLRNITTTLRQKINLRAGKIIEPFEKAYKSGLSAIKSFRQLDGITRAITGKNGTFKAVTDSADSAYKDLATLTPEEREAYEGTVNNEFEDITAKEKEKFNLSKFLNPLLKDAGNKLEIYAQKQVSDVIAKSPLPGAIKTAALLYSQADAICNREASLIESRILLRVIDSTVNLLTSYPVNDAADINELDLQIDILYTLDEAKKVRKIQFDHIHAIVESAVTTGGTYGATAELAIPFLQEMSESIGGAKKLGDIINKYDPEKVRTFTEFVTILKNSVNTFAKPTAETLDAIKAKDSVSSIYPEGALAKLAADVQKIKPAKLKLAQERGLVIKVINSSFATFKINAQSHSNIASVKDTLSRPVVEAKNLPKDAQSRLINQSGVCAHLNKKRQKESEKIGNTPSDSSEEDTDEESAAEKIQDEAEDIQDLMEANHAAEAAIDSELPDENIADGSDSDTVEGSSVDIGKISLGTAVDEATGDPTLSDEDKVKKFGKAAEANNKKLAEAEKIFGPLQTDAIEGVNEAMKGFNTIEGLNLSNELNNIENAAVKTIFKDVKTIEKNVTNATNPAFYSGLAQNALTKGTTKLATSCIAKALKNLLKNYLAGRALYELFKSIKFNDSKISTGDAKKDEKLTKLSTSEGEKASNQVTEKLKLSFGGDPVSEINKAAKIAKELSDKL